MELSPQQLCDVEFSEQWRGYNRDQVDDFIERVAAAVSTLQDRLRKMTERAVRAEQRSQEGTEADGAARRTLVLAQRTADATVAEAKDTAARLIAQAQEEARAIILAGETANETMPAVEPTARAEIADLEVTRSRLQADVAALESHVTDRRSRIKDVLDELQRRVDEGFDARIAQWPSTDDHILGDELSDDAEQYAEEYDDITGTVSIDDGVSVDDGVHMDDAPPEAEPIEESTTTTDVEPEPEVDQADASGEAAVDLAPAPPEWEPNVVVEQTPASNEPDTTGARTDTGGASERQEELAVPAMSDVSPRDVDDDTFFAQLRGALDDDAPLGPREDPQGLLRWKEQAATAVAEAPSLYDQGQPERRKFGRKKRRQS